MHDAKLHYFHALLTISVPFMSEWVKLSIKLAHSDGLGIQNKCVYLLKRYTSWGTLALESRERVTKYLVAFGLARDGWTNQHETVTNYCRLVQLNALLYKSLKEYKTNAMYNISNITHVNLSGNLCIQ